MAVQALAQNAPQNMPLIGNHPAEVESWRQAGWAEPDTQLVMRVHFAIRNRAALDEFLSEQQNPKSPAYRHWLTPSQFTQSFGPNEADLDAVSGWLTAQGFRVRARSQAARYLEFSGPEWLVERGFHIAIGTFAGGRTYGNLTDPLIPAQFTEVIESIEGLDNFRHSKPLLHRRSDSQSPVAATIAPAPDLRLAEWLEQIPLHEDPSLPALAPVPETILGHVRAFAPSDIQTFYDETPLLSGGINGRGGDCIAVVGDSDYLDAAVSDFDTQFGLAASSITREIVGSNPGINGDEAEALIDLEWSHAVAPGAPQRFYLGDIVEGISTAVSDNACSAINISFGFCGASDGFYTSMDSIFAQAAAQGQSVFVSSGDQGAAGLVVNSAGTECVAGTSRNVNEIAASPNVTGVGGTQFSPSYNAAGNDSGNAPESVWDESFGATGGGASAVFSKPSFQSGLGVPADGHRDVPDVAMIASPDQPGVFLGDDSNGSAVIDCCWGGTSLGAPLWSGISRLLSQANGKRVGNIDSKVYRMVASQGAAAGLRDVTAGINSFNSVLGFLAGNGYSQATGLGTVDLATFVPAFVGSAASTPTPTPTGTPTATPTRTPTPTPTRTATPAPTPSATPTGAATPTPSPSPTAIPTARPTPSPSASPTPTAIPTARPTPSPSPSPTPTAIPTARPTPSPTPTTIPTARPTPTAIPTARPTLSPSASPTPTAIPTTRPTPTAIPTVRPTPTPTPARTPTPTPIRPTPSPTSSPAPSATPTPPASCNSQVFNAVSTLPVTVSPNSPTYVVATAGNQFTTSRCNANWVVVTRCLVQFTNGSFFNALVMGTNSGLNPLSIPPYTSTYLEWSYSFNLAGGTRITSPVCPVTSTQRGTATGSASMIALPG